MNYKTIPELKKVLSGGIYRHVGLYTADGQKIKPFNTKIAAYQDQVKDILNFLQSDIVDPGIYIVKLKKAYSGAAVDYAINKGNIELKETETVTMQTNSLNIPFDFSAAMHHPAIKLQADITRLELENEDLNRQIEELNEYIGELEEKLKNVQLSELPKEPTAFEHAKSFLSELVSFGAPLLDKHFELKQQQLEIERMRAQGSKPAPPKNYQAPEVQKELELENKVKAWIESKSEDQETYNSLKAIYYNSGSLAKFAELLNNFNNELYEECKRQVG